MIKINKIKFKRHEIIFFLTLFISASTLHITKALEIHLFDVGNAESHLILFPSGYSILIDVGNTDYTTEKNTKHIASRLEAILGKKKIDILVLSHFHADHYRVKG